MIRFIAGALFGGVISIVIHCLCIAAGKADKTIENITGGNHNGRK